MNYKICQCCGMPLTEDILGKNADGSINEDYCEWCLVDGKFVYHDMDELIKNCIPFMVKEGFTEEQAIDYMKEKLPLLDYWKK